MKFLIALLTAATGVLHLLVGFGLIGGMATNWILVLNGVGYLVLLVLFWMASGNGGMIRWILLAYTLITFIGYFVLNSGNNFGLNFTIGLIIKAIELLLIILLFLYRGSERAATPAAAPAATRGQTGYDATRMSQTNVDTTVSSMAASAAAGMTSAAAGAVAATAVLADEAAETVDEAVDETADAVGDAVDYVGDKAGEAYEATTDLAGDAGDAVENAAEATVDAAGDAVEWVGDKAEDAYDATTDAAGAAADTVGDAVRGGAAFAAGAIGLAADEERDVAAVDAAEIDAADLAAEPSVDDLRHELEVYLKSFGPSSEFRKDIEYIEGIGAAYGQKLRAAGINTITDLIVNGATRTGRKHISDLTGIAQSLILTWVNHVDLFRIKGVAQEYADLLEQSGVDTVMELAQRNPANLHKRMLDVNEQKSLVRRAPHASEVQSWVEQAKSLRRLIHY